MNSVSTDGDGGTGGGALKGRRKRQDFAHWLETTRGLVGYTERDEACIRATRDLLLPQADAIAAEFYEQLLSRPETATFFAHPDGRVDRAHVGERAETLKMWLQTAIEAPLDERLATYLAGVGRAHTKRGSSTGVGVKARYLVAMTSAVQTSLAMRLDKAIADRAEFVASLVAWNKLLVIHLDLFLVVYGSAEGNPHWY